MKPARSKAHLAFIRSLPCVCCERTEWFRNSGHWPQSEAAHAPGARGMAQKRSDFDTLPLCWRHHAEQHQIGWPAFMRKYSLDVQVLIAQLRERPKLFVMYSPITAPPTQGPIFAAIYRNNVFNLRPVADGLKASIQSLIPLCREYLISELFGKDKAA